MRIRWNQDVQLDCVNSFDEDNDHAETSTETFEKGDEIQVDVFAKYPKAVDIQFGCGYVCYAVPNDWFTVI